MGHVLRNLHFFGVGTKNFRGLKRGAWGSFDSFASNWQISARQCGGFKNGEIMGNRSSVLGIRFLIVLFIALLSVSTFAAKEMDDAAKDTLELLERNQFPDKESIIALSEYNEPRILEIALWRIEVEINKAHYNEEKKLVVEKEILESLTELVTRIIGRNDFDNSVLVERSELVDLARKAFDEKLRHTGVVFKGPMVTLFNRLEIIKQYQATPSHRSLTFIQNPGSPIAVPDNGVFMSPIERLKKFREALESKIIEQPEVREAIYNLEFETLVKGIGNSAEPAFFYLMGLPGVGKDTSVEAYIDALYGDDKGAREHMFRVPLQRSKADAWTLLGSATGYIGSKQLSPFIKFLVQHSAGRYEIVQPKDPTDSEFVIENPNWKPGEVAEGYFPPERGIIFLNEFHNWSSEAKAVVVKEALEKGIFKINNPGKGISELHLPGLRFVAASNEGIDLYTNRDFDGSRRGEPLSYEEMMERWEKVAHDKDLLRQTIAKTASKNPPGTPKDEMVGTPEEILNRIHPSRMILMRPISPEGMKRIIQLKIERLQRQYDNAENGVYGRFKIRVTDAVVDFLQAYEYNPEEGARPLSDKVRSFVEYTFYQGLKEADVNPQDLKKGVTLDVRPNPDKTTSLLIYKGMEAKNLSLLAEQVIEETLKEKDYTPISDDKIDHLLTLEERLKDRIFGAERAIEKVSREMLLSEEARHTKKTHWNDHQRATSFAFFGPSSTGKSEMAKALINELYPKDGESRRVDIDGNQIKHQQHMEEFFWGRREGRNVIPSVFMQKYDQYNGNLILIIEEGTNIPKELQKSFYDLFRENHPKFADGKDRPMTNVTIIMTGNAGIEWYSDVPKDLPEFVRMAAWNRIYKSSINENGLTRETLEKYMPEPLINRIGEQNIIWFAPLTFKAVRELTLFKTNNYLEKLKPTNGRRGWEVGFKSANDHERVVELFEREGFIVEEQGSSIDRYIEQALNKELRALLLANKIETGARVALAPRVDQSEEQIKKTGKVLLDVIVEGRKDRLTLQLDAKKRESHPRRNNTDLVMTAIHEAGHEFVGRLLLGDKHKSSFITVIPGVVKINGRWIYYAGLRSAEQVEKLVYSKEAIERTIAGLLAGEVAQAIFSKGQRYDAGKSNDIERATQIARKAVGEFGLSPVWGNRVVENYESLSDAEKKVFNAEVDKILNRARNLAYNTILKNLDVFSELSSDLIVKGEIKSDGLEEFYSKNASRIVPVTDAERDSTRIDMRLLPEGFVDPNYRKSHNVEVADFFKVPDKIANIEEIVNAERAAEVAQARQPKSLPILSSFNDASDKPILVLAQDKVERQDKPARQRKGRQSSTVDVNVPGASCKNLFM